MRVFSVERRRFIVLVEVGIFQAANGAYMLTGYSADLSRGYKIISSDDAQQFSEAYNYRIGRDKNNVRMVVLGGGNKKGKKSVS